MEAVKLFLLVANSVLPYDNRASQMLEQGSAELVQCFTWLTIQLEIVFVEFCSFGKGFGMLVDFF